MTGNGRNRRLETTDNITGLAFKDSDGIVIGNFISYAQSNDSETVVREIPAGQEIIGLTYANSKDKM